MLMKILLCLSVLIAAVVVPIVGVIATIGYTLFAILRTLFNVFSHLLRRPQLAVR